MTLRGFPLVVQAALFTIIPFLANEAFGPDDIEAMSRALDDVCRELDVKCDVTAKEVIADRIIELARRGERSATKLRDRLLHEANGDTGS
jgi:hypothetical protein